MFVRSEETRRNHGYRPTACEVLQEPFDDFYSFKLKFAPLRVDSGNPHQRDSRRIEERCLRQVRCVVRLIYTHAAMVAASFLCITPL